ncbi:MAG: LGFP repeat-containing protein [Mycobacteriaceae bacterium]|nr:LGFP repeat-containing protein [Mycobacteriaceae bacterium]
MQSRRPAPSARLAAAAASLAALALIAHLAPHTSSSEQPSRIQDTQLAEQPLVGIGAGVTIREVSQHEPFSLVALTGNDLSGTSARIRAQHPDGSWGPWYQTEYETEAPPTAGSGNQRKTSHTPRGTVPIFVGTTTTVQIAVTRPTATPAPQPAPKPKLNTAGFTSSPRYFLATTEQPWEQNISAILISPPQAPPELPWTPPSAVVLPGQPPNIISRAQWGADESLRCGNPVYDDATRAAVVHHTAGSNDYSPLDSAAIVQAIYTYHSKTLGWCDIGYNALVDKYGQVFEGSAGGLTKTVEGFHTGGFNRDTWGVAMIGDFDDVPPTPTQIRAVGRLLGWRLGLAGVDPKGTVTLTSAGSSYTSYPNGATATLPVIFAHRDVGNTDCPGNAAYALLDEIRDIASHVNDPPEELLKALDGGAIYQRWQAMGGIDSPLGAPTSPEADAEGAARYATFAKGAMYWAPEIGAVPLTGVIYETWAAQGYERGPLGLPTSAEIQEPLRVTQNFQHGTLNFIRLDGTITQVLDGITVQLPTATGTSPTVPIERFAPPTHPSN